MDYLTHNVSVNLKRIRRGRNMSLDQLAEQSGVSKSMLAQIERGTANPSLGVLGKITSGLRIEFQELIERPQVDYIKIDPSTLVPIKEHLGKYRVWNCLPYEDSREIELYRIDVEPGGVYQSGAHGEKTREYLAVLKGTMTVDCHQHTEEISEGQIFVFETDTAHVYRNTGKETASCICFFRDYFRE